MKPRSAQLRQQQSQLRRARLEEMAAQSRDRFATTNRQVRRRDPNRGIITQDEWDQLVEAHEDSGTTFRYVFALLVVAALALLFFAKYDEEYNVEVPQIESGRGFVGDRLAARDRDREAAAAAGGSGGGAALSQAELEAYYKVLGVEGRLRTPPPSATTEGASAATRATSTANTTTRAGDGSNGDDASKAWRRENYRVRQQLRKAYEQHQEQQGQLVHCGRACEAHNQQVEVAYRALVSQVDRELFGVLLDVNDTKSARSTTPQLLKERYEAKRAHILATERDDEDRNMALEELKDAYDTLQDPDARKYYLLYGYKAPEHMRYVSARHGGWGQEMALGTYKYRVILYWLDFLHKYIGVWGETAVLLTVVVLVLARLPVTMRQATRVLEDLGLDDAAEVASAAMASTMSQKQQAGDAGEDGSGSSTQAKA